MTSGELLAMTRRLVGDVNKTIWENDSDIYAMLSASQREFVVYILGLNNPLDNYDLLSELIKQVTVSIGVSGYNLTSLNVARGGIISLRSVLAYKPRFYTRFPIKSLSLISNQYYAGNNYNPKFYVMGNIIHILISIGSYPVNVDMIYIESPGIIDGSNNPSINVAFHDVLCVMAEAKLRRSVDDVQEAIYAEQLASKLMTAISSVGAIEPIADEIGQRARKQDKLLTKEMKR
jgi:hypothetical protein